MAGFGQKRTYLNTNSTQGFLQYAMRNAIKVLAVLTVVLWAATVIFPLNGYLFAWGGGVTALVALMCAVVVSYREEKVVSTRGGPVYKKESPILFFINYLIIGVILSGLLLVCAFNFVAQLKVVQ